MPRISVVVPMYNVERYLTDCLESLAQQTHEDLEVIMVDDGSPDSCAARAAAFAERDPRFRLVRQANGGLGNARNTGADHATGDYITFVDSDDVVVRNAYELLVGSLEETGSDFASGNYHRLTSTGTRQAGMVTSAFTATRLRTHVSKHPALLNDRTAWNKVFRRSFWTQNSFRWPEGVLYEDIPVTLPAHVLAKSVDVLRQPIYLWRARVGDSTSITQRRTEPRAIRDRTRAVDGVSRFMAEQGQHELKKKYDRAVAEQDLRYFLQQLDAGDDAFRALFLDLVNDFFDRAAPDVFDHLPAIDRLKWHLVRRRLMPELLEVLRFEKSGELGWTPVIRKGRRFWGDYPFRGDAQLAIPDDIYRLDRDELPLRARIEDIYWDGDDLRLTGFAYISFLDLSKPGSTRIRLTLEESGHPESVVALTVRNTHRPDVTQAAPDGVTNYDWSGFEASVPVESLRHRGRFRNGQWRLRVEVRSHGITRRRWLAGTAPGRASRPPLHTVEGARLIPTTEAGHFALEVSTMPAHVDTVRVDGDVLEMYGALHGRALDPATAQIRLARQDGAATLHYPVAAGGPEGPDGRPFLFRVPLQELLTRRDVGDLVAGAEDRGDGIVWEPSLLPDGTGGRIPLAATDGVPEPRLTIGQAEVVLRRNRTGRLRLIERHFRPEVEQAGWSPDGWVELSGSYHEPQGLPAELVLGEADRDETFTVPVTRDGSRFTARFRPQAMATLAGDIPLPEGQWDLYLRAGRSPVPVRVKIDRALLSALPSTHMVGHRKLMLRDVEFDSLAVVTTSDLPVNQTARAGRRRMQTEDFPAYLRMPRRDAVLVDAYADGGYGDDARALHEELLRRDAGLDVVWSVVDGQAVLPEGVTQVARGGQEWYEALARSRYVVATDLRDVAELPKPPHQRVLQTWHGSPVTAVGLDDEQATSRLGLGWQNRVRGEAAQWDLLLASGPHAAAVLRRAFDYSGRLLETGLPRHDVLSAPDRDARAADVRRRLGIDPDRRVVLYAPTYRPDATGKNGKLRLDLQLDLDDARKALGDDHVLLVRPHPKVADTVPAADGETALDVSRWQDSRELLLAADVLVTDYSSLVVDFAHTGRPMVFWTYDLEYYRDHLRSLYVAPTDLPGPHVATAEEMLTAVSEATRGAQSESYADAYRAFRERYCPDTDGGASARALDALLEG
ncbi:MAG TPA: CDP-glycerol glycerophosphotransferase family protein [Actinomycetes bacterium]|nr:CDP-glycerol glycerophosphotransferase family protein [Actinomycetes bacterium]